MTDFTQCASCKTEKSTTDFGKDKSRPTGLNIYCKECANARGRKSKENSRQKCLDYNRIYRADRKDTVKEWGKKQYRENREKKIGSS